jgi:hypothetical protein
VNSLVDKEEMNNSIPNLAPQTECSDRKQEIFNKLEDNTNADNIIFTNFIYQSNS